MTLKVGIEAKEIVQINVSIITGILIFIAIGVSFTQQPTISVERDYKGTSLIQFTFVTLLPFIISAIIALFGFTRAPKILSAIGFASLLGSVIYYLFFVF